MEVNRFLGTVSHLAKFIPNLSSRAEKLKRRGKEGKKFQFGKEERKAFNEMKAAISKDTFIGYMTQANRRSLNVVQVRKVCEQYLLKKGDLSATHLEH